MAIIVGEAGSMICTHVNQTVDVSRLEVPQDGCLVQVGQVGHVLTLFKLWRVDLSHIFRLAHFFLQKQDDFTHICKEYCSINVGFTI